MKKTNEFFENQKKIDDRLLTKKEIAYLLNVSIKLIDKKVSMGEIPKHNIGRLVRFDKAEVLAWSKGNISKR